MSDIPSPSLSSVFDIELISSALLGTQLPGGYGASRSHVPEEVPPEDNPAQDFEPFPPLVDLDFTSPLPANTTLDILNDTPNEWADSSEGLKFDGPTQTEKSQSASPKMSDFDAPFDEWQSAGLYSMVLDELSVLQPSSAALMDSILKLTRRSGTSLRAVSMDSRVLRGIAEVESHLRIARSVLLRGESTSSARIFRKTDFARRTREMNARHAALRARIEARRARTTHCRSDSGDLNIKAALPNSASFSCTRDVAEPTVKKASIRVDGLSAQVAPESPTSTPPREDNPYQSCVPAHHSAGDHVVQFVRAKAASLHEIMQAWARTSQGVLIRSAADFDSAIRTQGISWPHVVLLILFLLVAAFCYQCLTYLDNRGIKRQGCSVDAKKLRQHVLNDKFREKVAQVQQEAEAEVGSAIVLATIGAPSADQPGLPSRPKYMRPSVPDEVRHNDDSDEDEQHPKLPSIDAVEQGEVLSNSSTDDGNTALIRKRRSHTSLLESQLALRSRYVTHDIKLVFKDVDVYSEIPSDLDGSNGDNTIFVAHYEWINLTLEANAALPLLEDKSIDNWHNAVIEAFKKEQGRLQEIRSRAWMKKMWSQFSPTHPSHALLPLVPAAPLHTQRAKLPPFLLAALLMVSVLHTLASVSLPVAQFVLASMKVLLFGALSFSAVASPHSSRPVLGEDEKALLRNLPIDLRTVLKLLQVEPEVVSYACCPSCFSIYHPSPSSPHPYPRRCTHGGEGTGKPLCNKRLVKSKQLKPKKSGSAPEIVYQPIKTFVYHKFRTWLADLLGRPGIEAAIAKSWKRPLDPEKCTDIMDSPAIRCFMGPDGKTLFSVERDGAVHLVFSLFIDWFNPYGNKKAGKSHSIGAIYLACLNLPPSIRYHPENIYLAGIIPGPKEPQLEQLNELLRPLVDELLELWDPGIYIEKTATRSAGRHVRAAVIPLVCDLPALRKTAGFTSHASKHFCSFCPLPLDDINNVDRSTWPSPRTWVEHLSIAEQWRTAPSDAIRGKISAEHGLRWSELLRLPYWDPTRHAVLDVMHNLFLGEVHHHCRQVWGVDVAQDKSATTGQKGALHTPAEQQQHLDSVFAAVCAKAQKRLANTRKDYLSAVARFNNIVGETRSTPTRLQLASAILTWAQTNDPKMLRLPPVLNEPVNRFRLPADEVPPEVSRYDIFTSDVLEKVREDIATTVLPSWMEKAPANFGSAAHGKLKADQWRTVSMVNLVITLGRLWGSRTASAEERAVLENFVHLVTAVDLASRRSMTRERATSYDYHMDKYLQGLRTLYNHKLVPNHHLSLHLHRFLEEYGPVHGWWSFPFERYNGILQRMNTNNRAEDMPGTFMRSWYIGAGLRWLMRATEWPMDEEYQSMIRSFDTAFRDRVRGTRTTDILSAFTSEIDVTPFEYDWKHEKKLAKDVYESLLRYVNTTSSGPFSSAYGTGPETPSTLRRLQPGGQQVNAVDRGGVRFAAHASGSRDSYIIFRSSENASLAGRITEIFYHQRDHGGRLVVEPFVVVQEYKPLSDKHNIHDPYRQFPHLNTHLVYAAFEPCSHVIPLANVISHFAFYTYTPEELKEECVVVRPLDRVGHYY